MNPTDRNAAAAAAGEDASGFRQLAEMVPQLVWVVRPDGYHEFFNRNWFDYTGMTSLDQTQGPGWSTILHPDDQQRALDRWALALRTGEPYEIEYRLRRASDGAHRWFLGRAHPMRDAEGRIVKWFGTCTDIHDQKLAAQRLAEESQLVETINLVGRTIAAELDLQKLVQAVTDATTRLTRAEFGAFFYNVLDEHGQSYALYTLSGVPREKFSSFPMPRNTDVFGPTFRGEGVVRLDDVTKDPRYGRNAPYQGMPPGHLPVRSYLAVSVVSRSGTVLGGLFFGHSDVGVFTERDERVVVGIASQAAVAIDNAQLYESARRANAAKDRLLDSERAARADAERANRMKDEFLSTVSHELRTPLNAILGWSQILRGTGTKPAAPGQELSQGLEVIERNARAQVQIIEDLLDMSRIISGKVRLDVQPVDLPAVIEAAVASMQPAADAKGIRLVKVLDPLAGPVSGDPNRLQQVVWNLLSNAIKFTPKGGRVRVTLERVNSHVEVTVADTGEGIERQFLPYVFERFRQAESSTTRRFGGLGLGLAIVKHLVELHGGSVTATSAGAGQGATFVVSLPITPLRAEPAPAAGTDPETDADARRHPTSPPPLGEYGVFGTPSLKGVRVLVVDDDADARSLIRRLLEECGASVELAGDVDGALSLVDEQPFDAIVSDIGMPGRDGFELIRKVRQRPPQEGGQTPAVALTAYARSDDRARAMMAGFDMHVAKPVEPAELCAVLARLARRGR